MASVFRKVNDMVDQVKRITYDMSFQNNLTLNMGGIYPVFCKEVLPGDSVSVNPTFALKMMPMVFPVQTRMNATIHFFYIRNRSLWKDWMDFIGKTKSDLSLPYLHLKGDDIAVGSLADYLGIPTVSYDSIKVDEGGSAYRFEDGAPRIYDCSFYNGKEYEDWMNTEQTFEELPLNRDDEPVKFCFLRFQQKFTLGMKSLKLVYTNQPDEPDISRKVLFDALYVMRVDRDGTTTIVNRSVPAYNSGGDMHVLEFTFQNIDLPTPPKGSYYVVLACSGSSLNDTSGTESVPDEATYNDLFTDGRLEFSYETQGAVPLSDHDEINPFATAKSLSVLPFRAYEFLFNSFYRNQLNDPFMINGKPEYNNYLPTKEGGEDLTKYALHYRNWEDDFLTTAVQSPQQGPAPLVGVVNNTLTFRADDGTEYSATAEFDDKNKVTSFTVHSSDMPEGNVRSLIDLAQSGISINDFRNVNSLQRWLEANQRRGYKYQDQVMTHYGVEVKFDDYDYPEFIGGVSRPILINQVTQTMDQGPDMPLGSYAGQGSCVGQTDSTITKYCDEHGFILGVMSICPVPVYSQLVPKHFFKFDAMDYFFPEFGKIGMQPITYKECFPIGAFTDGKWDDEFGYQKAWYEYMASTDESHGLFRSQLRNFLINREFEGVPTLNHEFLAINPADVNDVFSVADVSDKFLGQIYFDCKMKRPIPAYGAPAIE